MEQNKITLTGTVVFLKVSNGSKSDGTFPFLYVNKDTIRKIQLKGDNPFENHGFDSYDGKVIVAEGTETRSKVFVVEKLDVVSSSSAAANGDIPEVIVPGENSDDSDTKESSAGGLAGALL